MLMTKAESECWRFEHVHDFKNDCDHSKHSTTNVGEKFGSSIGKESMKMEEVENALSNFSFKLLIWSQFNFDFQPGEYYLWAKISVPYSLGRRVMCKIQNIRVPKN